MRWLIATVALGAACSLPAASSAPPGSMGGGSPSGGSGGRPPTGGAGPSGGSTGRDAGLASPADGSAAPADATAPADAAAPADAGPARTSTGAPGEPVGLPLVVTDYFDNRGWFGDETMAMSFGPTSTVIVETAAITGPCGARPPGARGRCLQFVYTPPAGYLPPVDGGWIGDFFLRTLRAPHPEVLPPAQPGQPNWGYEPGVTLPAGATAVSFYAAAATDGLGLTIRVGTDKDAFVLPQQQIVLTTSWRQYHVPLGTADYNHNLYGPFAWVIEAPTSTATFYLDDIVWDGNAPPTQ